MASDKPAPELANPTEDAPPSASAGDGRRVTIVNQRGLHARASAALARRAADFQADLTVSKDGTGVGATSIMGLMMLGAAKGDTVTLTATGPDADEAVAAVADLVENRFGEDC
ncbi:HPr family phosphocarrier protein [Yunchengibacter salinarum]|uniref:HPr family phosphocarrier protein n=1 Tax=Yunchengibacter salinarum TaxID=3133399 RepID=UPI0035B6553F